MQLTQPEQPPTRELGCPHRNCVESVSGAKFDPLDVLGSDTVASQRTRSEGYAVLRQLVKVSTDLINDACAWDVCFDNLTINTHGCSFGFIALAGWFGGEE